MNICWSSKGKRISYNTMFPHQRILYIGNNQYVDRCSDYLSYYVPWMSEFYQNSLKIIKKCWENIGNLLTGKHQNTLNGFMNTNKS